MSKSMYDIIKKQNGEHFAKAIRNYDNGIFDIPNIDKIVKYAGRDAEPILNYLISLKDITIEEYGVHMDPITLLDKAGYNAYVADTLEKQNAIKQYFAPDEELCTFHDPSRFQRYHIINAVRKDVDKIKRGNPPQRDDEYGTSVISIQILKTGGFISIKNRYNHTVDNCDNTLNSNPDNIIKGLSDAIRHHFDVDFSSQKIQLPDGYVLIGKQICKYDYELNNVYFCNGFYIKDGNVIEINHDSQLMLGGGNLYDNKRRAVIDLTDEGFPMFDSAILKDKKLLIVKNEDGSKSLTADGETIFSVKDGHILYLNPKDSMTVILRGATLRGDLDFSHVNYLDATGADFGMATSLKMPTDGKEIRLGTAILPACDLDFSGTEKLDLEYADLRHVTNLKFAQQPGTAKVLFSSTKLPVCDLDFSNLNELKLDNMDLSKAKNIKMPKHAKLVSISSTKFPTCHLDVSGADILFLRGVVLKHLHSLKMPTHAKLIDIFSASMPVCDLDFTNVQTFRISDSNCTKVHSLKLPPNGIKYISNAQFSTAIEMQLATERLKKHNTTQGRRYVPNTNDINER